MDAATVALTGRAKRHASRFASIELRVAHSARTHLAPLGYAIAVLSALSLVVVMWQL